jgi:hypothetical protein
MEKMKLEEKSKEKSKKKNKNRSCYHKMLRVVNQMFNSQMMLGFPIMPFIHTAPPLL